MFAMEARFWLVPYAALLWWQGWTASGSAAAVG